MIRVCATPRHGSHAKVTRHTRKSHVTRGANLQQNFERLLEVARLFFDAQHAAASGQACGAAARMRKTEGKLVVIGRCRCSLPSGLRAALLGLGVGAVLAERLADGARLAVVALALALLAAEAGKDFAAENASVSVVEPPQSCLLPEGIASTSYGAAHALRQESAPTSPVGVV